jgi:hypothetical protein
VRAACEIDSDRGGNSPAVSGFMSNTLIQAMATGPSDVAGSIRSRAPFS